MTELEATVVIENGEKCALFDFMGNTLILPIINSEGCRLKDLITVSYNGRDEFVRRTNSSA